MSSRRTSRFNTRGGNSSGRGGVQQLPTAAGAEGKEPSSSVVAFHRSVRPGPPLPSQDYEALKAECLSSGKLWEDPEFPAEITSLSNDPGFFETQKLEWRRPTELCENPQYLVEGTSRFDAIQGNLGDAGLLAAVASLTLNQQLVAKVVHAEQNFKDGYAGIFRFTFWHQGQWIDVCVDDRLPSCNGRLVYMHSQSHNEFWTALLEKAYAKLMGNYAVLKGVQTIEALVDFTGGVGENFRLRSAPDDLFNTLLKGKKIGSLMGCTIEADASRPDGEKDNGLIVGHAYSITDVILAETQSEKLGAVSLIRVRNPWGNVEWEGRWSDRSEEWSMLSDEEKKKLGLVVSDDGEFWMCWKDFQAHFTKIEVCSLSPDSLADDAGRRGFEVHCLDGAWIKRVNAGGCREHLDTFWVNPQFKITLKDPDGGEDDLCTVVIALMQKDRRKLRSQGKDVLRIGYMIYQLKDAHKGRLNKEFFCYNKSVGGSPTFTDTKEVCGRHRLPAGTYVVVPSTYEPNKEADFLLRIFTEKAVDSSEIDDETGLTEQRPQTSEPPDEEVSSACRKIFDKFAGDDKEIDANELRHILNAAFKKDVGKDGFSAEASRSMISLMDSDRTGMLGLYEFNRLLNKLRKWKTVFASHDGDRSGNLNSYELRPALSELGFSLSNETLTTLILRFSGKDGLLSLDEFVLCVIKLGQMIDLFYDHERTENEGRFSLDEFIHSTTYS